MKDLIDFQDAKEYVPDKPTHRFFRQGDVWMVRCLKTNGSFSTELWKQDKIPDQQCPCCEERIKK